MAGLGFGFRAGADVSHCLKVRGSSDEFHDSDIYSPYRSLGL